MQETLVREAVKGKATADKISLRTFCVLDCVLSRLSLRGTIPLPADPSWKPEAGIFLKHSYKVQVLRIWGLFWEL